MNFEKIRGASTSGLVTGYVSSYCHTFPNVVLLMFPSSLCRGRKLKIHQESKDAFLAQGSSRTFCPIQLHSVRSNVSQTLSARLVLNLSLSSPAFLHANHGPANFSQNENYMQRGDCMLCKFSFVFNTCKLPKCCCSRCLVVSSTPCFNYCTSPVGSFLCRCLRRSLLIS